MKLQRLVVVTVLIMAMAAVYVSAVDKSASIAGAATTKRNIGTYTETSAGSDAAVGGNVSELNLSTSSTTSKWQGYIGSVTASLFLGSGTNTLYSFGSVPNGQIKAVFASTDSAFNFAALAAATAANIDTTWAFNTTDQDSGTNNFDDASRTIAQVTSVPVINLTTINSANASVANVYQTGVFKDDGTVAATSYGVMAFGVQVVPNIKAYDNSTTVDYELVVPVNSAGVAGTQTYYFFLDIE